MIYWLLLIVIVIFQIIQKKKDVFYLKLAFYIFLGGALLSVITLVDIAEFFIRISFILFIVGLVLTYFKGFEGGVANKPK